MLDIRIGEAIQVIGALAESDLSPSDLSELDTVLSNLTRLVRATELAKRHRLSGHVSAAVDRERVAESYYESLPYNCKW